MVAEIMIKKVSDYQPFNKLMFNIQSNESHVLTAGAGLLGGKYSGN